MQKGRDVGLLVSEQTRKEYPMKTDIRTSRLKLVRPIFFRPCLLGLAVTIAAGLGIHSARGGAIDYNLVLTENSATSLTLAYSGPGGASSFSVLNTSPDNWTITVLSQTIKLTDFEYDFNEPEDPLNQTVNEVFHNSEVGPEMFVRSDLPIAQDNNGMYFGVGLFIGSDTGGAIFLTFNDVAAITEETSVPDSGSTLGLLALSLGGLLVVRRFRFPRLA